MVGTVQVRRACLALVLCRLSAATDVILTVYEGDGVSSDCEPVQNEKYCAAAAGPLGKEYLGQTEHRPRGCYVGEDGKLAWRDAPEEGFTPPASQFFEGEHVCVKYEGKVEFGTITNGGAEWKVVLDTGDDKYSAKNFGQFVWTQKRISAYRRGRQVCGVRSTYAHGQQIYHGQRIYADRSLPGGVRNGDAGVVQGFTTTADGRITVKWDGADSAHNINKTDLRSEQECEELRLCRAAGQPSAREHEWLRGCLAVSPSAAVAATAADCTHGRQPLGEAAYAGAVENVKTLVAYKASVDHRTDSRLSPLAAAVWQGHRQAAEVLVEAGADVEVKGEAGKTVLMTAATYSHPEIMQVLIEKRADPSEEDYKGWTTLNWAVSVNCLPCIDLALKNLTCVDHRDTDGSSALHLAARKGFGEAAMLLMKHGADAQLQNGQYGQWQTPIDLAEKSPHPELADGLRTGELPASLIVATTTTTERTTTTVRTTTTAMTTPAASNATSPSLAVAPGSVAPPAAEPTQRAAEPHGGADGPPAGPAGPNIPFVGLAVGGLGILGLVAVVVGLRRSKDPDTSDTETDNGTDTDPERSKMISPPPSPFRQHSTSSLSESPKRMSLEEERFDVFISHANRGESAALFDAMSTHLAAKGKSVFFPTADLAHTASINKDCFRRVVQNSKLVVAALSEEFFTSEWCEKEIQAAKEAKIKVIGVYSGSHRGAYQADKWVEKYGRHDTFRYIFKQQLRCVVNAAFPREANAAKDLIAEEC